MSKLHETMEYRLSALVVDDEDSARKLLVKLLEETLFFNEIRMADSTDSALVELDLFEPDLIFLDIKMPGRDGLSFIDELPRPDKRPGVVFVTAFDHYAIEAIKKEAFDYLLKPVNREELNQCIGKYARRKKEAQEAGLGEKPATIGEKIPRIMVGTRSGTLFINPATILYCKADGNYTTICTGEKKHLCSLNIGKLHDLLDMKVFIRLGRSYLINFEHITIVDRKDGTVTLTRDNETAIVRIPKHHLRKLENI